MKSSGTGARWRMAGLVIALILSLLLAPATAAQEATPIPAAGATPLPATPDATPLPDDAAEVVVETTAGPVHGVETATYRLFQGIPYAAPPVGDLRWQSPQPVEPWTEPRDATQPGNRCPQAGDPYNGPPSDTEDCLYLNVTAPTTADPAHLKPVMVWLHGGGLIGGAGSDYDARQLAVEGDVVVIAPNYRLGIFGFFAHPELENSGAYGFEDQQAALRWVQENAAAFGGDPERVTVFGQSAGGVSVCALLTSPTAAGQFHQAIIQSGACIGDAPASTFFPGVPALTTWPALAEIEATGAAVAAEAGCDDPATAIDCLRQFAVADMLPITSFFSQPGVGTPILPEDPQEVMAAGEVHPVPLLTGLTRDEGTMWAAFHPQPITPEYYQQVLTEAFGDDAERVAAEYPVESFATPGLAWAAVVTDRVWACSSLDGYRFSAAVTPTYVYEFLDREAPAVFPEAPEVPLGAYHAAELPYLFDVVGLGVPAPLDPEQRQLSEQMIRYWANFAHTGDPNGAGLPVWEPFLADAPDPFVLGLAPGPDGIAPFDFGAEHRCEFWSDIAPDDWRE